MKFNRVFKVLVIALFILISIQAKKHPKLTSTKQQYLRESLNKDEIAKEIFIGVAKSFNISLPQNVIDSITYENWQVEELETALNNFGAVMIDQSYLKDTLSSLRNIFTRLSSTLPNTEESNKIINSFLNVFSDEKTFNTIKAKLFQDKSIDCQLYLWGALDYLIFDQYQVIGETFGKVVYLMSQYLQ